MTRKSIKSDSDIHNCFKYYTSPQVLENYLQQYM